MSLKERILAANIWSVKYFAISIGVIISLFIVYHWGSKAYLKYGPRKPGLVLQRAIRHRRAGARYLSQEILGIPLERWLLYLIYWAINLILALTDVDLKNLKYVAKRFGWVSVANFVLLVFLALKNTPLAPLSGRSYEKLRPLHKIAGYTCIFTSIIHAAIYLSAYSISGDLDSNLRKTKNLAGAMAGLAMVIIGFSTITMLMRNYYELFYIIHIVMFLLIVILVGMHRPEFATSTLIIIIFTACIWLADRLIRFLKICWNLPKNYATIYPMADGAVRVKLHRSVSCKPGSHVFLWMPSIRFFETHPFTLVSGDTAELLIRSYDGYTRSLYKAAQEQPGRVLRCSIDGAYGQIPNFMDFDRIILVAGGSGATFTFSIALDIVKEASAANIDKKIDFIWAIKRSESLQWFEQEIQQLQDSGRVNFYIYTTSTSQSDSSSLSSAGVVVDLEKEARNLEKGSDGPTDQGIRLPNTHQGRPDILNLVSKCISETDNESRIGIGACGPTQMIKTTRKAASQATYDTGPSITLHTEEFEW